MRLAVDVTALHDARTGIGVVTGELLARLARRPDVEVVAFATSWRGRDRLGDIVPSGVEVARRPMAARPLRMCWRRSAFPPIEWFTGRVDAVLGTNFVVPPTGRAGRVAIVHDLTAWHHPELCTPDTLQYPALVRRAVASGAHIVTPSRFVADEVVELVGALPDRVHPVHWAASQVADGDPAAGRAVAGAERYLLSLGTIEPRKDHALLVAAFDDAADGDADLRLVVAGPDGWGVARYDQAVAAARHRDRIVRLGYVSDADRADLLAGAVALAYPSLYEGFGLPALEALFAGVPVVATRAGALPEVLGDAAELVEPGDRAALTAAIGRLASATTADRARQVERGRAHAGSFTWERAADEVLAALSEAAAATK